MGQFETAPEVAPSFQPERRWADETEGLQQTSVDGNGIRTATYPSTNDIEPSSKLKRNKWVVLLFIVSAVAAPGIGVNGSLEVLDC